MKKYIYLLLLPGLLTGNIVETDSFDVLEEIVNLESKEEILVVTDIDNTLMRSSSQLGSVLWGEHVIKELQSKGINPIQAQEVQDILWKAVQPKLTVYPVDEKATNIIRNMQEQNIPIIGLTARSIDECLYTLRQLETIGIIFSEEIFSLDRELDSELNYSKGILFASPFEKKFDVLFRFLDKKNCAPKKIIFIDDKHHHIQEMNEACTKRGILFEGIHFTKVNGNSFNVEVANLQWEAFPSLLSDNQACYILEEQMLEKEILNRMILSYQEQNKESPNVIWNESTSLFALIGNSVEKSKSAMAHNAVMSAFLIDGIYLKIPLKEEELKTFFQLVRKMPFKGLSVTMPLKEMVLPFLDELTPEAKAMGAVNTILKKEGKLIGYNTDGEGAVKAIEEKTSLEGKRVIIIGAGGAAKAIAYTASNRKADVVVLNRSYDKAKDLALKINGRAESLENMRKEWELGYDILINCTPNPLPFDPKYILSDSIIMDIRSKQEKSSLLFLAKDKGAQIVFGQEMWINQAVLQEEIWFDKKTDRNKSIEIISNVIGFYRIDP